MHIFCPHCKNPVEIVESGDDRELPCPSCGSQISMRDVRTKLLEQPMPAALKVGRFTLTEQLGQGAFGSVWRARDPDLGRDVAMKVPRAGVLHAADARSDVWSLGVMLYEMLTGERPFRGAERMILLQILQDEPRPPRRLNDTIPRDLETITLKCLTKEPARRYQSASELSAELRRWLAGEPIHARPIAALERLWRWSKRNPRVAALSAAVLLLLVVQPGR